MRMNQFLDTIFWKMSAVIYNTMTDSEPTSTKRPEEVLVDAIYAEADGIHSEPAPPAPPGRYMQAYRYLHKMARGRESSGESYEGYKHRISVSAMETKKQHYPARRFIKHVEDKKKCFTKIDLEATYNSVPSNDSNDSNDSNYTYFLADPIAPPWAEALVFLGKLIRVTTVEQNEENPDTGDSFTQTGDGKEGAYGKTPVPILVFENKRITKTQHKGWPDQAVYKYDSSGYKYDSSGDMCSDALVLKGGKRRTRRNKKKSKKTKKGKTTKKSKRKPRGSRRKR